jgi:hypothetical protein
LVGWSSSSGGSEDFFAHFSAGNGQHHVGKIVLRGFEVATVEEQKHKGGYRADPLVAVHERVVFDDVEQVRGGHFADVGMQKRTGVSGRRHAEGGFEQIDIPDAREPAVAGDLVLVDFQHL